MTTFSKVVWGDSDGDRINCGDSIRRDIAFKDPGDNTQPLILTGHSVAIADSDPPSIKDNASFTILDSEAGTVRFFLSAAHAADLRDGETNWFKPAINYSNGDVDVRPKYWIRIS